MKGMIDRKGMKGMKGRKGRKGMKGRNGIVHKLEFLLVFHLSPDHKASPLFNCLPNLLNSLASPDATRFSN